MYRFAKGGSYAGEFRRGAFHGMGLRFMRAGGVKSGRFEEGAFVEALGMDASDAASSKAAEVSQAARRAAEASKNQDESNARFAARVIAEIFTFPPFAATLAASVVVSGGAPMPDALASMLQPLAAANRPLVLVTLGVLFQPFMPKLRARTAARFLATRYACALAAAAAVAAAIPPGAGNARFILPALALMPVPSVMVQYALDHEGDAALAGCLVNYSQIASLAALAALALLSAGAGAAPRWVLPAAPPPRAPAWPAGLARTGSRAEAHGVRRARAWQSRAGLGRRAEAARVSGAARRGRRADRGADRGGGGVRFPREKKRRRRAPKRARRPRRYRQYRDARARAEAARRADAWQTEGCCVTRGVACPSATPRHAFCGGDEGILGAARRGASRVATPRSVVCFAATRLLSSRRTTPSLTFQASTLPCPRYTSACTHQSSRIAPLRDAAIATANRHRATARSLRRAPKRSAHFSKVMFSASTRMVA